MHTFITPDPVAATIVVAGAQVRVTASDRSHTAVLVQPIDETNRSDLKVANRTKVAFANGQLSVKTTVSGSKKGSVAITIDLPTSSSLVAYLAHSSVQADGVFGDCELHLASGRVQLDAVEALQANLAAGDITVGHIRGRADIEGRVFTMRIGEVKGPVGFSSTGGQARIDRATNDLDLRSDGGDFDIGRLAGNVTATTGNGAIRIAQLTRGGARLTNGSGNIEVGITEGVAAVIDVESERGAVLDAVSSEERAARSDHAVTVHARTRHGDIAVQRAAAGPGDVSVASTN